MQSAFIFIGRRVAWVALISALMAVPVASCSRGDDPAGSSQSRPAETAASPASNRMDVPAAVRQNLGITFAKAEYRSVQNTLRVAGRFELMPQATREYHTPLAGRIELLVSHLQTVDIGTPLLKLDAPAWRDIQNQLATTQGQIERARAIADNAQALEAAHEVHRISAEQAIAIWEERRGILTSIREAGGGQAEQLSQVNATLAQARSDLAETLEKTAEHDTLRAQAQADLREAESRLSLLASLASTLTGLPASQLLSTNADNIPVWRTINTLTITASQPGSVQTLHTANGTWLDERSPVLTIVQPTQIRFRAKAFQSDLSRLRDGLQTRIIPPAGGSFSPSDLIEGTLALGLTANADERTLDLFVTPTATAPWARAGVSGLLEVITAGSNTPAELAVPLTAVAQDGLTSVIFRRDPRNPDAVIRIIADTGLSDGRYIEIKSGLLEGDEVVVDGDYQLMLATSGSAPKGGHFHSDGTFHAEGDEESGGK